MGILVVDTTHHATARILASDIDILSRSADHPSPRTSLMNKSNTVNVSKAFSLFRQLYDCICSQPLKQLSDRHVNLDGALWVQMVFRPDGPLFKPSNASTRAFEAVVTLAKT